MTPQQSIELKYCIKICREFMSTLVTRYPELEEIGVTAENHIKMLRINKAITELEKMLKDHDTTTKTTTV